MREYSVRFIIVMIIGICVLLLFMTGKSGQKSFDVEFNHSSIVEIQKNMKGYI